MRSGCKQRASRANACVAGVGHAVPDARDEAQHPVAEAALTAMKSGEDGVDLSIGRFRGTNFLLVARERVVRLDRHLST
jgi:hypothetical protein